MRDFVIIRRKSKKIKIGNIYIGEDSSIKIQSMLSAPSNNIQENIKQAKKLEKSGCEILRIAVPVINSAKLIPILKKYIKIPIIADIHFDYKIALKSIYSGADKIRINPGNITPEKIKIICKACEKFKIPIRIGVNSGSLEKKILEKYKFSSPEALAESALNNIKLLENFDFNNIIISVKSSCVQTCVSAYKLLASQCDYPMHLGITEAGIFNSGIIKSAIGIGSLLLEGIGDTLRVSLSQDPVKEIETGIQILKSLNLRNGINIISCPTCGRCTINIFKLARELDKKIKKIYNNKKIGKSIKIALMGCVVNGPGEALDSDYAITGVNNIGIIFKHGKIIKKIPQEKILKEILEILSLEI